MKFILAGCVRNCESYIDNVFKNIEKICHTIHVEKIVIAYDISHDKTLLELIKQKKRLSTDIEILINKNALSPHRTQNISNARNKLLHYIYNYPTIIDKFIMMDFDDVCAQPINIDVFKQSLLLDADCITFNNKNYYDFWALSLDNYQFSAWHLNKPHKYLKAARNYLLEKFSDTQNEYIECDSAFNGFGIYNVASFKNCSYQAYMDHTYYDKNKLDFIKKTLQVNINIHMPPYDCEHRLYHLQAKQKNTARLIIYKKFLFPEYSGPHTNFIKC